MRSRCVCSATLVLALIAPAIGVSAMLKAIHASEDIVAARQKAVQVIEKMRGLRLTNAAELVATAVEETLAYYTFPEEHWRRIRTTDVFDKSVFWARS